LKNIAEQNASAVALTTMEKKGYVKHPPNIYSTLSNNGNTKKKSTDKNDVLNIIKSPENINQQFSTKGKKQQHKYTSTVLAYYCKKRDLNGIKLCMEMKANVNELDSTGLTCTDILFLGKKDPKIIKKCLDIMRTYSDKNYRFYMSKNIYDKYKPIYEKYKFVGNENFFNNFFNSVNPLL